jgi:hypothetical protein
MTVLAKDGSLSTLQWTTSLSGLATVSMLALAELWFIYHPQKVENRRRPVESAPSHHGAAIRALAGILFFVAAT